MNSRTPRKTQTKEQLTQRKSEQPHSQLTLKGRSRALALMLNRLYASKMVSAWQRLRILPARWLRIKTRMKQTIDNVFKRLQYQSKWTSFQNIRRAGLNSEQRDVQYLQKTLKKQRATMIKLLIAFMTNKKKRMFHLTIKKLKDYGNWRQFLQNSKQRRAFRIVSYLFSNRIQQTFNKIKDSRANMDFSKKLRSMFAVVKEIHTQNRRWAFVTLRREMLRNRKQKASQEIKELNERMAQGQDEEIRSLKERQEQLQKLLAQAKKQKEDITAQFQAQVKEADTRTRQMKDHLQDLKTKQKQMKQRIVQLNQQIKAPYSLQQIYQLCYENFLWTVSQHTEKTFTKQILLQSLCTPIVPIDLPIQKLKQQNSVLKQLLSQYILLYGQKKIPQGTKLELPYQYLLKENSTLYRMLITLLPNAQFLKDEILKLRQTFEEVGGSLKLIK